MGEALPLQTLPVLGLPPELGLHVEVVTWEVGRLFGFQAFNQAAAAPGNTPAGVPAPPPQLVPATIPLAADHLKALLGAQYARLMEARAAEEFGDSPGGIALQPKLVRDQRARIFREAVLHLTTVVLLPYKTEWCRKVDLHPLPLPVASVQNAYPADSWEGIHACLSQLALFFLLWVEGANMRHMDCVLWTLFYCALHAPAMAAYASMGKKPLSEKYTSALASIAWRHQVRNRCAPVIATARKTIGLDGGSKSTAATAAYHTALLPPAACAPSLDAWNRVVQPVMAALTQVIESADSGLALQAAVEELVDWCGGEALRISQEAAQANSVSAGQAPVAPSGAHKKHPSSGGAASVSQSYSDKPPVSVDELQTSLLPEWVECEQAVLECSVLLALHGDGSFIVDRLITPLMQLLAHEMDALAMEDMVQRVGYDDFNESLCSKEGVHRLLNRLRVTKQELKEGRPHDAFRSLTVWLGQLTADPSDNAAAVRASTGGPPAAAPAGPADGSGASSILSLPELEPLLAQSFDPKVATCFWSTQVAVKTFYETRSMWAVIKVFHRVFVLNLMGLHALMLMAFYGPPHNFDDWAVWSSLVPMYAVLTSLERLATRALTQPPAEDAHRRQAKADLVAATRAQMGASAGLLWGWRGEMQAAATVAYQEPRFARLARRLWTMEGAPILGLFGWVEPFLWGLAISAMYAWSMAQPHRYLTRAAGHEWDVQGAWLCLAVVYIALILGHSLVTLRYGWRQSFSSLFWLPGAYSSNPASHCSLSGSLSYGFKTTLWQWVVMGLVYAIKWVFEYFVVCKPLVKPVRALLGHSWPMIYGLNTTWPSWFLVVVRVTPVILLCLFDGVLAYTLVLSIQTLARGLLRKDLISLHSWAGGDLVRDFVNAPGRFWDKCMSRVGKARWAVHQAAQSAYNSSLVALDATHLLPPPSPGPPTPTLTGPKQSKDTAITHHTSVASLAQWQGPGHRPSTGGGHDPATPARLGAVPEEKSEHPHGNTPRYLPHHPMRSPPTSSGGTSPQLPLTATPTSNSSPNLGLPVSLHPLSEVTPVRSHHRPGLSEDGSNAQAHAQALAFARQMRGQLPAFPGREVRRNSPPPPPTPPGAPDPMPPPPAVSQHVAVDIPQTSWLGNPVFQAEVVVRSAQWRAFQIAWHALVEDLRRADVLSDEEVAHLQVEDTAAISLWLRQCALPKELVAHEVYEGGAEAPLLHVDEHAARRAADAANALNAVEEALGPVLLPGLVTAGVVQRLVDSGGAGAHVDGTRRTLKQLRAVLLTLLTGMGVVTPQEARVLLSMGSQWRSRPGVAAHQEARQALLAASQKLAQALMSWCPSSKAHGPPASAKSVLDALKNVLKAIEVECKAARAVSFLQPAAVKRALKAGLDALHMVQARAASMDEGAFTACLDTLSYPAAVPSAGVHLAESSPSAHPATPPAERLVKCLCTILATVPSVAQPRSSEAQIALQTFLNSLAMKDLKEPASLSSLTTHTVLTPLYHEEVVFALHARTLAQSLITEEEDAKAAADKKSDQAKPPLSLPPIQVEPKHDGHRPSSAGQQARLLAADKPSQPGQGGDNSNSAGAQHLKPPEMTAEAAEKEARIAALAAGLTDLMSGADDSSSPDASQGISIIAYLRAMHSEEWANFTQRIARQAGLHADVAARISQHDFMPGGALASYALDLQLWASYRAQVLARTVRGMEAYQKALRVLAAIEVPPSPGGEKSWKSWVQNLMSTKCYHVVSAQAYGKQRASRDLRDRWCARGIELLMARHHSVLRVAYLDGGAQNKPSFSVLLKARPAAESELATVPQQEAAEGLSKRASVSFDTLRLGSQLHRRREGYNKNESIKSLILLPGGADGSAQVVIEEAYRVRLPANPHSGRGVIIGEGKPENQNHAMIFCVGEAVQVIDMNQDNRLAEALKMRSVLQELQQTGEDYAKRHAMLKTMMDRNASTSAALGALTHAHQAKAPVALVGLREYVFSERAGALGAFAAATEYAFSSVIQRAMAEGGVRLHYGHPDVFNRLHIITRGGVSKATRTLHVSEDVFSGMAHMLRGGRNAYVNHSFVGKGRDMGLDSILGFEQKISTGNAQVFLSREMARLTARLDLPRLAHFYYSGLGYFVNAVVTMAALRTQIISVVILALAGVAVLNYEGEWIEVISGTSFAIVAGMIANLPYVSQSLLDVGILRTFTLVAKQMIQGVIAFAGFRLQTTCSAFMQGLLYPGSAGYVATGRGFAYRSVPFTHLYALYGRTHLQPGAEMAALLTVGCILLTNLGYGMSSLATLTWPLWMQTTILLLSPFWFSPESFSWAKVRRDWRQWARWMFSGETDGAVGASWATWNRKTLEAVRNWHGRHAGMGGAALLGLLLQGGPPFLVAAMTVIKLLEYGTTVSAMLLGTIPVVWFCLWMLILIRGSMLSTGQERSWHLARTIIGGLALMAAIAHIVVLAVVFHVSGITPFMLTLMIHVALGLLSHRFALHALPPLRFCFFVDQCFWVLDVTIGACLLCIVSVMCIGGILTRVQAVLLFSTDYAKSVREGRIARSLMANTKGGLTGALRSGLRSRLAAQRKARSRRPGGGAGGPGGRPDGGAGQGRGDEDEEVVALLAEEEGSDSDVESAGADSAGTSGNAKFSARMAEAIEAVERGSPRGPLLGPLKSLGPRGSAQAGGAENATRALDMLRQGLSNEWNLTIGGPGAQQGLSGANSYSPTYAAAAAAAEAGAMVHNPQFAQTMGAGGRRGPSGGHGHSHGHGIALTSLSPFSRWVPGGAADAPLMHHAAAGGARDSADNGQRVRMSRPPPAAGTYVPPAAAPAQLPGLTTSGSLGPGGSMTPAGSGVLLATMPSSGGGNGGSNNRTGGGLWPWSRSPNNERRRMGGQQPAPVATDATLAGMLPPPAYRFSSQAVQPGAPEGGESPLMGSPQYPGHHPFNHSNNSNNNSGPSHP